MTTLIAVYNSSGCVGRCDAHCHNATHPACTCICGGMNHGVGLNKAIENTRELCDEWLDAYKLKVDFTEVEVPALYTTKTRTAVKIARHLNIYYGCNAVYDVKRRGRIWEVRDDADFLETFKSLKDVRNRYPLRQKAEMGV